MKHSILPVVAALAAASGAFAADPYIESDGTSGILTDYKLKSTTRIEVDFALTETGQDNARVFGADRSHTALHLSGSLYVHSNGSHWQVHVGDGTAYKNHYVKSGGTLYESDTVRHVAEIDYPNRKLRLYTNGAAINQTDDFDPSLSIVEGSECAEPVALFARQNAAGDFTDPSKARIYGVKIHESGSLVHDFVPCLKDGMPGFKDVAGDGGFLCNPSAETAFTYGGDILVEESPYVATPAGNNTDADKHLYVDTEYFATADTRLELDYALTEERPSGATWYVFSGESQFGAFINNNGAGFVVKASQWKTGVAPSVANRVGVKRTAILDAPGTWCGLVTGTCTNDHRSITTNGAFASTSTIKLGSYAGANNYFASMKIYGCRIYESGTLVRDFRPSVIGPDRAASAVVGLKDELTGAFISYPAATASKRLSCGGKMELPPYVETLRADSRYIDTGYLVTENTKVALDYAVAGERGASDTWYLFGAQGDSTFTALINKNGFGYNNGSWHLSAGMATEASLANVRRTVVLDNPAALGVVTTEGVTNLVTAVDDPTGRTYGTKTLKLATPHDEKTHFATIRIYGCRIWEKENGDYVLKRDYVPAVENNVAGLRDATGSDTTFRACASTAASPLGYGGAFAPTVTPATSGVRRGMTSTLTASAPGAASYRWLKNGEAISGGESGTFQAAYTRAGIVNAYQAIAIYAIDDATAESEPSEPVTVEDRYSALVLVVR